MAKNIVICSDGTGLNGLIKSNVSRLFAVLDDQDPAKQIECYHSGVGVDRELVAVKPGGEPDVVRRASIFKRWTGLAIGNGLFQNVEEMYGFLARHYSEGDQIFLFGFSRGAFTVRVLAGLLFRCGLLRPDHLDQYRRAFKLYEPHFEQLGQGELRRLEADIAEFRTSFSRPIEDIKFLGIWDTVKSVGYVWPRSLPHTRYNPIVRTVRHALSIDESRSFYVPTTWGGLDGDTRAPIGGQDVQEVWFAGNHSDVGGGYEEEHGLSNASFRWIVDEACALGLRVNRAKYHELVDQSPSGPFTSHDELGKWGWRVTEWMPRWELENDPPPPRRLFRWGPSGRRQIVKSTRKGEVLIDSRAGELSGQGVAPWSSVDHEKAKVRFIDAAGSRGTSGTSSS